MIIGSQYYRPPFPNDQYWADDFSLMRDSGLNTVQLWLLWGWIEATPGEFRFDDYDRLVQLADEKGLSVVLSTIGEIHPYWIHREVPGSEMINNLGHKVISSNRGECHFGLTPGGCTDHPGVWDRMAQFLTKTVDHYKGATNLVGWDAWNELRWNVYSDGLVCFCEHTIKAFHEWLDQKYGGLDGLNKAWIRRYICWEDVLPGKSPSRPYTEMMAFEHFITCRSNQHGLNRYEIIKAIDPDRPVTVHGAGPCAEETGDEENHTMNRGNDWALADGIDGVGCSSFPKWFHMVEEDFPARVEFVASAAQGKDIWLSELQGGRASQGFEVHDPVDAASQQRWIYNGIARGVKTILFWCWRDEIFGRESGGFGMNGSDGFASQRLEAMKITGDWAEKYHDFIADYTPATPRVGVWLSPQNYYLHWAQEGSAQLAGDSVRSYCRALVKLSIAHRVVEEEHLDALAGLETLFLPRTLVLDDHAIDAITKWVEAGGKLICESECGAFDSRGIYRYPQDRFLAKWGIADLGRRLITAPDIEVEVAGKALTLPAEQWITPFDVDGCEMPSIRKSAGKGEVLVIGSYPGQVYARKPQPEFEQLVSLSVAPDGNIMTLSPAGNTPPYCRLGKSGGKDVAFVFSPIEPQVESVTIDFGPEQFKGSRCTDITAGKTFDLVKTDSGIQCNFTPGKWGVTVLVAD